MWVGRGRPPPAESLPVSVASSEGQRVPCGCPTEGPKPPGPSSAFQILGLGPPQGSVAPRAPLLVAAFLEAWGGGPAWPWGAQEGGPVEQRLGSSAGPWGPSWAVVGAWASGPGGGGGRAAHWKEEWRLSDVCLLLLLVCVS